MFYAISGCPVTKPASIHWSTWTPSFKFWPSKTHSFWSNTDNLSPRHPRKSQAKLLRSKSGHPIIYPFWLSWFQAWWCYSRELFFAIHGRNGRGEEETPDGVLCRAFYCYGCQIHWVQRVRPRYLTNYSPVSNESIGAQKKKLHQKLEAVCKYFAVLAERDLELQYFCKQKLSMNGTFIRDSRVL